MAELKPFDVIFKLSGMWFNVTGEQENNMPKHIDRVRILCEGEKSYGPISFVEKEFREDFALIIQAEIEQAISAWNKRS